MDHICSIQHLCLSLHDTIQFRIGTDMTKASVVVVQACSRNKRLASLFPFFYRVMCEPTTCVYAIHARFDVTADLEFWTRSHS